MSKMANKMISFLENGGYLLGYSEMDLPDIDDLDKILTNNIKVWEYKGYTEEEYYGG